MLVAACSSSDSADSVETNSTDSTAAPATEPPTTEAEASEPPATESPATESPATDPVVTEVPSTDPEPTVASTEAPSEPVEFTAEVWADNWFALYVNGELVGEDSVPITTERSFNAETVTFEATYPLTIGIEAKDFKETDSGIEYIGAGNQQMGDGGLIAQITDDATGETIAVTDGSWASIAIHRAPLNTECEKDPDPDTTCQFEIAEAPADWTAVGFDDSGWVAASEWPAEAVGPKDGYDEIDWIATAQLIWGTDLEVDNTVLFRTTVAGTTEESAASNLADPDDADEAAADFSEVESIVADFVDANELNGAGLALLDADNGVVYEGYWGDFEAERSSFVASMSKQVTAGVLMHLDDEGVLDIDAPISEIVGEAWGTGGSDDTLADRTIAQMLSQSAGMVGLADATYAPYICQFFIEEEIETCGAAIYSTPDDDGDVFEPDSQWEYGGAQWQLAGAVAEFASGESWNELVQRIYVDPCRLSDGFGYNNHWITLGASSTDYPIDFDGDLSLLDSTDNPHMEGGVYSTVADYSELLLMHLRGGVCPDGQVLSQAALDVMHADRIGPVYGGEARNPDNGYGIGWWVDRTNGQVFNDGAFGAQAWLDLDEGYGVYLVVETGSRIGQDLKEQLQPVVHELLREM